MAKKTPTDFYTGVRVHELAKSFIDRLYATGFIDVPDKRLTWYPNQYVYLKANDTSESKGAITRVNKAGDELILIRDKELKAFGVTPKNKEQVMALAGLLDDSISLCTLTGRAGTGKCSSLDSIVYTPTGPIRMGELKAGDIISTPDGTTAPVLSVHPQGLKNFYKVIFTDGSSTETCDEHLWLTQTSKERDCKKPGKVRELKEIISTLKYRNKRNHSIPMTQPVFFDKQELSIDSYLLGALIGDGTLTQSCIYFSNTDPKVISEVTKLVNNSNDEIKYCNNLTCDYRITGTHIRDNLKDLGLLKHYANTKFIPNVYKVNSIENRIALLQGLMDTDGTVSKNRLSYTSVSEQLIQDVKWIVQSLGGTSVITDRIPSYTYKGEKKLGQRAYTAHINLPNEIKPFRSEIKSGKYTGNSKYFPRRYIDHVESLGQKEGQCIYIDHPDHLYLTDEFIVTHNTLLTIATALQKIEEKKYDRIIITRPMSQVGKYELGALPGDINEKFGPYLENYVSNIQQLTGNNKRSAQDVIQMYKMEAMPMQLIRGASWVRAFIIADEVQVLDHHEMLTLGTRVGEGSKLVVMGDLNQRDEDIDRTDTGLHKIINSERMKKSPLTSHIELIKSERSELAALFADTFEEK